MRDFMNWKECEKNFIRNVTLDKEKINSIIEIAVKRKKFIELKDVNDDNVSFIVEGYYEIIKELLVALLLKNGLKSKNHQCLISYFYKNYPDHESEANLISQMSYLRNKLNYYGESIDIVFYEKHKKEIISIINLLLKYLKE